MPVKKTDIFSNGIIIKNAQDILDIGSKFGYPFEIWFVNKNKNLEGFTITNENNYIPTLKDAEYCLYLIKTKQYKKGEV